MPAARAGGGHTNVCGSSGHEAGRAGAEIIVRMAKLHETGPTGTFVDENGPFPR